MKKEKNRKSFRKTKRAVITGLLLFVISQAVSLTAWYIFGIMGYSKIVNSNTRVVLWIINLMILFILAGMLVNILLRHIFNKKSEKLIDAMEKLADGEFSVRLDNSGKITDTGLPTVASFNNMAQQLQGTEVLNKDFAGNFSHELKTPLGTISGFAKVLKDTEIPEEEKNGYLDIIIEESERLTKLSGNILLLSKIENQTAPEEKSVYNLTEQLRMTVAVMYQQWNEKNIEIVFEGEDLKVFGNRELLSQIWVNLLDNAIKFSPENESIYINVIEENDRASVSIKNYGCTLTQEDIPRIFEKFYQGESSKTSLGNGLGLSMAKKIAELHGGNITAALSGSSITVTVKLPLSQ